MYFRGRLPLCVLVVFMLAAVLVPGSLWAQANFVYTNDDQAPNTVSAFSVGSNGALTPVPGSPFTTGGDGGGGGLFTSNRIGVAITGNLLFVPNTASDNVSVFNINPSTGVLTSVAGSPFATGNHPLPPGNQNGMAVAATPDGKFLMVASNGSANVAVFSIAANGTLSPVAGSPFATGGNPSGIKISPDGKFLAVALGNVQVFTIAADGSLTSAGVFAAAGPTRGLDIDCASSHLYAGEANLSGTIVDVFGIDTTGALSAIAGSPFNVAAGTNSNVVLLSPDDKHLFVSNQISSTITAFTVASDGSLSLTASSPVPMSGLVTSPAGMATNKDGTLLYVADSDPAISVFQVDSSGGLTEVPGSPFFTGSLRGLHSLTAFPAKSCAAPVSTVGIEIKPPALPPVRINPRSGGKITVAILSTASFNAVTEVDRKSLTFGHSGSEASLVFCNRSGEDVNNDGLPDLVCHFSARRSAFVAGDTNAVLNGKTVTGAAIQGSEAIRTVSRHKDDDGDGDHDKD